MKNTDQEITADSVACWLHNNGSSITGNTQKSDAEWFARRLYGFVSTYGMGCVQTIDWSLSNEDFEKLHLKPDREWTRKRWETLSTDELFAWHRLAQACLAILPALCDRIGHRGMEQAKAIHAMVGQEVKARLENGKAD